MTQIEPEHIINADVARKEEEDEMHNFLPYCKVFISFELYHLMPFFTFLHRVALHKWPFI